MQIGTVFGRLWASLYHTGRPRLITVRGASKVTGAFAGGGGKEGTPDRFHA